MNRKYKIINRKLKIAGGFVLPLVLIAMIILSVLAVGAMMASYGSRIEAVKTKAQTEAMLAAEAGYEQAIFWMCQQNDILGALQAGGGSGVLNFGTSGCSYEVSFQDFLGARPVFQVTSTGISGRPVFTRIVDVSVMQETAGWAMAACRVPTGASSTSEVYFKTGEEIDMPLHINNRNDSPDQRDIWINGTPQFLRRVEMGETRRTSGGSDKYSSVMTLFEGGIYFEQPDIRITDEAAVTSKINRFRDSTAFNFRFTPQGDANISTPTLSGSQLCRRSAVQLEFFVDSYDVGKVRITNHCTILGYRRNADSKTYDFNAVPGTGGNQFERYYIYAYHYAPDSTDPNYAPRTYPVTDTYVSQQFGGYTSEPGGQVYVDGDVIIGSGDPNIDPNMVVKGKITVVASGNIWIGDNIIVDGPHDANGKPVEDNPNVLGLIAQGVIKVVDPGMSRQQYKTSPNYYPNGPNSVLIGDVRGPSPQYPLHYYKPIGNGATDSNDRTLPDHTVVEAAITVGGGGFGAENVPRSSYGGRKEFSGDGDELYVRGSITEVVRGVVGVFSSSTGNILDGYEKHYYIDNRLMSGILPADIWFTGKYIPAPAGWHDHAPGN
jgi:type II secretory pathway pseudopilin PulG